MKIKLNIVLVSILLLLCGCHNEPSNGNEICVLSFGSFHSDPIKNKPGNYAAKVDLSDGSFAETENGYYTVIDQYLCYAEKIDLTNWFVVCPDPECEHDSDPNCAARVENGITFEDGRFFFMADIGPNRHLYTGGAKDFGLMYCSMAGNGTDRKQEYVSKESMLVQGGDGQSYYIVPEGYIVSKEKMNSDGSYTAGIWGFANGNETLLYQRHYGAGEPHQVVVFPGSLLYGLRGDNVFCTSIIDGDFYGWLCWAEDEKMKQVKVENVPYPLHYISDGILRSFVPNDGYYDYDLETGESVRLGDAQLENSGVFILQPNCIFESNMIYSKDPDIEDKSNQMDEYSLRFFDGQQWHDVALPREVTELGQTLNLGVRGLQSDCVIFSLSADPDAPTIYRMALDQEDYKLEKIGQLRITESAD